MCDSEVGAGLHNFRALVLSDTIPELFLVSVGKKVVPKTTARRSCGWYFVAFGLPPKSPVGVAKSVLFSVCSLLNVAPQNEKNGDRYSL